MTGCNLAIQGHTVSIISDLEGLEAAKVAISMVLSGSEHGSVYKYLKVLEEDYTSFFRYLIKVTN